VETEVAQLSTDGGGGGATHLTQSK